MAYAYVEDSREELGTIEKGSNKVLINKIKSGERESVDIREYYTDEAGELKPSKKGIRLNTEVAADLILSVAKTLEADELSDVIEKLTVMANGEEE